MGKNRTFSIALDKNIWILNNVRFEEKTHVDGDLEMASTTC